MLSINISDIKKIFVFSEKGIKGTVVTVNRMKHYAFIKRCLSTSFYSSYLISYIIWQR